MQLKTKLALTAAGLLSLGGVGAGVALAGPGAAPAPVHTVRVVAASQVTPQAQDTPAAAPSPAAPNPAPADNVQSGDQTTPDSATAATAEADTASADEATTPENDGSGGHADPAGANVDHQFDGQE